MKRVTVIMLLFVFLFTMCSCGSQPAAEDTVRQFCEAMKTLDSEKMQGLVTSFDEDSMSQSNLGGEYGDQLFPKLQEWAASMTYEILSTEEKNDEATVVVRYKYVDASPIVSDAMGEYFIQAFSAYFSGISEEELSAIFSDILEEKLESVDVGTTEKDVEFILKRVDRQWKITEIPREVFSVITANFLSAFESYNTDTSQTDPTESTENKDIPNESENKQSDEENENEPNREEQQEESAEQNTYQHNTYYDITDMSSYKDSIGYTHVIHKVLAKQDATVSASLLAYSNDGSVIGKGTDKIVLTKGQYNYFCYVFDADISEATFQANAKTENDSYMIGPRNAVEMVQYNKSGNSLYITFKQLTDEIGGFAKFKILFYKDDIIVDEENGYFSIYANNMTKKGDTDVAELLVWGKEFDKIEFYYEP